MGVWGVALYSGDFAADLRSTVAAVSRLPFDADRLAGIVCDSEPSAAKDPNDSDYATFWLILADQFAKRGLQSDRVRKTALRIIDEGRDLEMLRALGMSPADLAKRARVLENLRGRILQPAAGKPRSVIRKPQAFLMDVGDVLAYPTENGKPFNPYLSPRRIESIREKHGRNIAFAPNGWSACVILARGKAFEYLTWYQALTLAHAVQSKPTLEELAAQVPWRLRSPATCPRAHFERMQLERIAAVSVDHDAVAGALGPLRDGTRAAVGDISIANELGVTPAGLPFKDFGVKVPRVETLREILERPST